MTEFEEIKRYWTGVPDDYDGKPRSIVADMRWLIEEVEKLRDVLTVVVPLELTPRRVRKDGRR